MAYCFSQASAAGFWNGCHSAVYATEALPAVYELGTMVAICACIAPLVHVAKMSSTMFVNCLTERCIFGGC